MSLWKSRARHGFGKGRTMDFFSKLRVKEGGKVDIRKISPDETCGWNDRKEIEEKIAENTRKLQELQYRLYAENRQSLLIVLQAMDAGGKDGVINHVLYAMNPQGCRSQSFKVPTSLEASHDFLWREHNVVPHNGEVVIFNRSHYEYVLVQRVHDQVDAKTVKQRFSQINEFEKILRGNNTVILKFFLNISKEEQLKRFKARLDDPAKHWKITENDYKERDYWDAYMTAFSDAISHCSTDGAPWFIIPSNDKTFRNLAVSDIIVSAMEKMNPEIPASTIDVDKIRLLYHRDREEEKRQDEKAPAEQPEKGKDNVKSGKSGKRDKGGRNGKRGKHGKHGK